MTGSRLDRGVARWRLFGSLTGLLLAGAVQLGSSGSVPEAHAASAQDTAAADALFDSGLRLMEEGDFEKACVKFRKSFDLDPGVGTLLNLARCYEQGGRLASSWTTYREASALARQLGQTEREEHARSQAKALEPRLSKVQIELADGLSDLPGFKLTQDGTDVVLALLGEEVPVDGGSHVIIATAEGHLEKKVELEVDEEGKVYPVSIDALEKDPEALAAAPVEEPVDEQPEEEPTAEEAPEEITAAESSGRSVGPYILGAVGLVGLGVGTAFGIKASGHNANAEELCFDDTRPCSATEVEQWETEFDNFNSSSTLAYIGWGVGGAALAGAVVWYIIDTPSTDSDSQGKVKLMPLLGANAWGVGAQGAF